MDPAEVVKQIGEIHHNLKGLFEAYSEDREDVQDQLNDIEDKLDTVSGQIDLLADQFQGLLEALNAFTDANGSKKGKNKR